MAKKRRKKGDIRDQIQICVDEISEFVKEALDYAYERPQIKNRASLAILLYDINRTSAKALAMLRFYGVQIKMDVDFMRFYKDDPFCDNEDYSALIDLKKDSYILKED